MLDGLRARLSQTPRSRLAFFSIVLLVCAYLLYPVSNRPKSSAFPTFAEEEYEYPVAPHVHHQDAPKRVAIVGAGASGSAAAFFLRRAGRVMAARTGKEVLGDIVVFDKEGYVGGRSTTVHPHNDPRHRPVELGASIFVEANRHMVKAARKFNLTMIDPDFADTGVGIWDGHNFLYTTSTHKSYFSSWWDTLSAIRRYGPLSPLRTQRAIGDLLKKFSNLYNPVWLAEHGAARSVDDFAERVGLGRALTTRWGEEYAKKVVGVGSKWAGEVWEGSTRVNYASDLTEIHALGASVSMATGGAKQVEGGNWRIFQAMLDDAEATVHLGVEVSDIVPLDDGRWTVKVNESSVATQIGDSFDQVFFAAPWHLSPISKSLSQQFDESIPPQKYVHLHVTLLGTTRDRASPAFFGLDEGAEVPGTILTTGYTARHNPETAPARFQSITWHGETYPGSGEYVVKIFSMTYIKDKILRNLLGGEDPTWIVRKEWNSYPKLSAIASYAPVEPVKGLQYLASLEPWVSTMETQTLSAREAVARVVEDWWDLGMGECRGGADAWDWSCEP